MRATEPSAGRRGGRAHRGDAPIVLRKARHADAEALRRLHRRALGALSTPSYTAEQVFSLLRHLPTLDLALIDDGTYFVAEHDARLVACGGWSRRPPGYEHAVAIGEGAAGTGMAAAPVKIRAMYTDPEFTRRGLGRRILAAAEAEIRAAGHRDVALDALLPGVPLYESAGYRGGALVDARLPDGTPLPLLPMHKRLG